MMKFPTLVLLSLLASSSSAFVVVPSSRQQARWHANDSTVMRASSSSSQSSVEASLTPELKRMTQAFRDIGDDKLRYKQLLYMANQLPPLEHPEQVMVSENKVPGCLSTVHVDGTATWNEDIQEYTVDFVGESDGLLTKGLVALLVRGLSGCTASEIQKVDPAFIQEAGISQSLTPGRNNGFLNMLKVMKQKALTLEQEAKEGKNDDATVNESADDDDSESLDDDRPMYNAIVQALQPLKPVKLELVDNSHQHAGHAGAKGLNGESHFDLTIVAEAFDGLNLVKRHQLIYMMLGEVMPQIHALQIQANTPQEVE